MSLFHSKIWWQTKVGSGEEFDASHLCLGKIGSDGTKGMRIAVGSFSGKMRIYQPSFGEFKPHHMIFDQDFEKPIIGLEMLTNHSNKEFLCVLFLKGFAVYNFFQSEDGLKSSIKAKVEFKRPCYSMVVCEMTEEVLLCIQTIDGMLAFYDMNKLNCSMQIKSFILPSPMVFIPDNNFLVIQNSSYQLEAYKYDNIFAKGSQVEAAEGLKPDWDCLIGENAMSFELSKNENSTYLLAACENHLFVVIAHSGKIKYIKKLQCIPSRIIVNNNISDNDLRFTISSFSHHLLFYKNFELIWASKIDQIAHGIKFGTFGTQKGLMATLNEEGWLSIIYLGAEPPKARFQYNDSREKTYEALVAENRELKEKIESKKENEHKLANNSRKGIVSGEAPEINFSINFTNTMSHDSAFEEKVFIAESGAVIFGNLKLSFGFSGKKATNICATLKAPSGLKPERCSFNISSLVGGGTPKGVETKVRISNEIPITDPYLEVSVCYDYDTQGNSISACCSKKVPLKLQFFSYIIPLVKEAEFKLTIESNKLWPTMDQLFAEYIEDNKTNPEYLNNPNAMSFLMNHGVRATVIIAKNSNKMRVQGDTFEAIYLILHEIVRIMAIQDPSFMLTYNSDLPLKDFFDSLQERMEIIKNLEKEESKLEEKTNEIMHIQKRLLTRYKEKNPTPLNNLDSLFELVFRELTAISKVVGKVQTYLVANSQKVTSSLRLILLLLKIKCPISEDGYTLLQLYINSEVETRVQEIGWIDITHANITFLIQTVLLGKTPNNSSSYKKVENLGLFIQRFTKLIDNIAGGVLHDYKFPVGEEEDKK